MNRFSVVLILGVILCVGSGAMATTDEELHGAWITATTNHGVRVVGYGTVQWNGLTFSTNATVTWTWKRDQWNETNSGTYHLAEVERPGLRTLFNLVISPTTMAVWRPLTLTDVTVGKDNRFPLSWTVLKWRDEAGNLITFIREDDAKERRTKPPTVP